MRRNKKSAMRKPTKVERIAKRKQEINADFLFNSITLDNEMSSKLSETENKIYSVIGVGIDNAVHSNVLTHYLGISERILQKYIENIRRSGYVIIADKNGYYKPNTQSEVDKYIKREEKRAKSIFYTLKSARNWRGDVFNGTKKNV